MSIKLTTVKIKKAKKFKQNEKNKLIIKLKTFLI